MEKQKAVITVVGKDTVGIIAAICAFLAEHGINILDISQTIVQDYFNMMMIVDLERADLPFARCQEELSVIGQKIGVDVKCQREEIFEKMHRI